MKRNLADQIFPFFFVDPWLAKKGAVEKNIRNRKSEAEIGVETNCFIFI